MSNIYNIDFKKLFRWMLPLRLRMPRMLAMVNACATSLTSVYMQFRTFRNSNLYYLGITPQTCYLEKLLNDRYDFTSRRIYIDDAVDKPPTYIYQTEELKPLYLGTAYIYTSGESGDLKDDFIVFVPTGLQFESAEMVSLVKAFKLAGTKFKIQRY